MLIQNISQYGLWPVVVWIGYQLNLERKSCQVQLTGQEEKHRAEIAAIHEQINRIRQEHHEEWRSFGITSAKERAKNEERMTEVLGRCADAFEILTPLLLPLVKEQGKP